jgi:fermentation-respiration switch protein FrsA (DUF1100 family)
LQDVKAPISIFHGTKDGIVTYKNAKKLNKLLKPKDELITIHGGSHNNLFSYSLTINKLDSLLKLP